MTQRLQGLFALHRLMEQADDGASGGGSGGSGGADDAAAAKAKADAEAAAKAKAEADAAAAAAAAGGNKPTDAEAKLLKELMAAKEKAKKLADAAATAEANLKAFEGIDATKARELLAAQAEAERKALESKGEYDRIVKQMGEQHSTEAASLKAAIEAEKTTNATLAKQIADLTVGSAFGASKFVQDEMTLTPSKARVIYGSHFEFKDGQVVGYDKPAGASERTVLVDASGTPLSFEDALKRLVNADPDKESLLRARSRAGAGSATATKGADKARTNNEVPLSGMEKIAAGLKALAK